MAEACALVDASGPATGGPARAPRRDDPSAKLALCAPAAATCAFDRGKETIETESSDGTNHRSSPGHRGIAPWPPERVQSNDRTERRKGSRLARPAVQAQFEVPADLRRKIQPAVGHPAHEIDAPARRAIHFRCRSRHRSGTRLCRGHSGRNRETTRSRSPRQAACCLARESNGPLISSGTLVSEMLMRQKRSRACRPRRRREKVVLNLSHFRYKRTDRGSAAPKDRTGI
jgi:hypothetical protein